MILNPGDIAIDYAFARPAPAAIVAAGVRLVVRYISPTRSNPKNITEAERDALHAAGLSIALVWENATTDPLGGRPRGLAHGAIAGQYARDLGLPPTYPIIPAVDFNATTAQLPVILAYLGGFKETSGCEQGVYGKDIVITAAHDAGLSTLGWQTVAWSGGRISPHADVLQHAHNVHPSILVLGAVDDNTVLRSFQAWGLGSDPIQEDDMPKFVGNSAGTVAMAMLDGSRRELSVVEYETIYAQPVPQILSDADWASMPIYTAAPAPPPPVIDTDAIASAVVAKMPPPRPFPVYHPDA